MIDGRASSTARLIAAATVSRAGAFPLPLPPSGAAQWCELFLSTCRADRTLLKSVRSTAGRACWRAVESAVLPGIVSHWMRRKREIDRLARAAAAEGCTQLVVLGAGLDTLAFRLAQERVYRSVISADHPATLSVVRAATRLLRERDTSASLATDRGAVALLGLNLDRDDAGTAIAASRDFDPAAPTLFVLEGVLMYLPEAAVARVLRSLAAIPTPRARLVASWMLAEPGRSIGFHGQSRVVTAWLRMKAERMLWSSSPEDVMTLISRTGWSAAAVIDLSVDTGDAREGRGLRGEQLIVAERHTRG